MKVGQEQELTQTMKSQTTVRVFGSLTGPKHLVVMVTVCPSQVGLIQHLRLRCKIKFSALLH